ncbi:MAG: transglutaminase domain-containing protein [Alistipes sp.]|nr:transglutaminase domain-containing protein [Alistipes sp.]
MRLNTLFTSLACVAVMTLGSCQRHFITDSSVRESVHEAFEARRAHFTQGDIFTVFEQDMTTEEREAMEFLYSAMSSADMGDYQGEYFLDNVRMSLKAREQMAWGKDVPEDLFRHFVLPVRVNNERMDEFRMMYYDTLRMRVEGLSLHDAALEVNHWCHEKATYVPSDSRTSSPMATMLTAEGRCGEESTFTVSALRAVGIPARQVYTPRWAHTDSNHAWVEVWIDGKWYFMGACEPEPELNVAWFNQPATRAMLMHTRVYGDYRGTEDVIQKSECYTEINVIENYAPMRKSTVTIVDAEGKAVEGATVEFKIFNYGEYTTVVTLPTNSEGQVTLHMGLGDMLIWASYEGSFGFGKLTGEAITVKLDKRDSDIFEFEEDMTPPVPGDLPVNLTDEAIAANKERLAAEDAIRLGYKATFMTPEKCADYSAREQDLIVGAMGNWRDVKAFIDSKSGAERERAVALLGAISRKDLHDTSLAVLEDALTTVTPAELTSEYVRYILNPRIVSEFLQPYRKQIREVLTPAIGENPSATDIAAWVKENISPADEYNPISLQATPAGVLRIRMADKASRDRFFVAACRTYGIAARMGAMSGYPQYMSDGEWIDVMLDGAVAEQQAAKGAIRTTYDPKIVPAIPNPNYYSHCSICRIENGQCRTIRFDVDTENDLGATADPSLLTRKITLDEGYYMLTTGNRMASGKVLARSVTFNVKDGEVQDVKMVLRPANDDIGVIGSMDPEKLYLPEGKQSEASLLSTVGRGYFIVAVMGTSDEPTNHASRGLASIADVLDEWKRPMVVLHASAEDAAKYNRAMLGEVKAHFGVDVDDKVRSMICSGCNSTSKTLPVIAVCDTFGRVVYFSQGYNTSLADQLKSVIHKL